MSTPKKLAATAAVLAAVGSFVSFGVFSAFSTTQSNTSSLTSAAFSIAQVPSTTNLLSNLTNLIPGDFLNKCVAVTNNSGTAVDLDVVPTVGANLDDVLRVTVQEIASVADSTGTCAGAGANVGGALVNDVLGTSLLASYDAGSLATSGASQTRYFNIGLTFPIGLIDGTNTSTYSNKSAAFGVDFVATQSSSGADRSAG